MARSFSSDKLDFPSVLFRHLDRISITLSEINSIFPGYPDPNTNARNLKAQILGLEVLIFPYLPENYYTKAKEARRQFNIEWDEKDGYKKSIKYSLELMKILMIEIASADLLPRATRDVEEIIEEE